MEYGFGKKERIDMANQVNGILSPFLRKKRFQAIFPFIKGNVLDFGCGIGRLTKYIKKDNYLGVDIDEISINIAKKNHSNYKFLLLNSVEEIPGNFDVIVLLALIEHVKNPEILLSELKNKLNKNGCIVLTTPHPMFEWIHDIGSKIGLFSSEASEEHETLIDFKQMQKLANLAGLKVDESQRFLCFANQMFVLSVK